MPIAPDVLDQAVDWLMHFQAGEVEPHEMQAFEAWLAESVMHVAAWQRAETVMQTFRHVPSVISRKTLSALSPSGSSRQRVLRMLGVATLAMPFMNLLVRGDVGEI